MGKSPAEPQAKMNASGLPLGPTSNQPAMSASQEIFQGLFKDLGKQAMAMEAIMRAVCGKVDKMETWMTEISFGMTELDLKLRNIAHNIEGTAANVDEDAAGAPRWAAPPEETTRKSGGSKKKGAKVTGMVASIMDTLAAGSLATDEQSKSSHKKKNSPVVVTHAIRKARHHRKNADTTEEKTEMTTAPEVTTPPVSLESTASKCANDILVSEQTMELQETVYADSWHSEAKVDTVGVDQVPVKQMILDTKSPGIEPSNPDSTSKIDHDSYRISSWPTPSESTQQVSKKTEILTAAENPAEGKCTPEFEPQQESGLFDTISNTLSIHAPAISPLLDPAINATFVDKRIDSSRTKVIEPATPILASKESLNLSVAPQKSIKFDPTQQPGSVLIDASQEVAMIETPQAEASNESIHTELDQGIIPFKQDDDSIAMPAVTLAAAKHCESESYLHVPTTPVVPVGNSNNRRMSLVKLLATKEKQPKPVSESVARRETQKSFSRLNKRKSQNEPVKPATTVVKSQPSEEAPATESSSSAEVKNNGSTEPLFKEKTMESAEENRSISGSESSSSSSSESDSSDSNQSDDDSDQAEEVKDRSGNDSKKSIPTASTMTRTFTALKKLKQANLLTAEEEDELKQRTQMKWLKIKGHVKEKKKKEMANILLKRKKNVFTVSARIELLEEKSKELFASVKQLHGELKSKVDMPLYDTMRRQVYDINQSLQSLDYKISNLSVPAMGKVAELGKQLEHLRVSCSQELLMLNQHVVNQQQQLEITKQEHIDRLAAVNADFEQKMSALANEFDAKLLNLPDYTVTFEGLRRMIRKKADLKLLKDLEARLLGLNAESEECLVRCLSCHKEIVNSGGEIETARQEEPNTTTASNLRKVNPGPSAAKIYRSNTPFNAIYEPISEDIVQIASDSYSCERSIDAKGTTSNRALLTVKDSVGKEDKPSGIAPISYINVTSKRATMSPDRPISAPALALKKKTLAKAKPNASHINGQ